MAGDGYGECTMLIDSEQQLAYPPERARGFVARVYLYMHETYELELSEEEKQQFIAWDKAYPETEWETTRRERIQALQ